MDVWGAARKALIKYCPKKENGKGGKETEMHLPQEEEPKASLSNTMKVAGKAVQTDLQELAYTGKVKAITKIRIKLGATPLHCALCSGSQHA